MTPKYKPEPSLLVGDHLAHHLRCKQYHDYQYQLRQVKKVRRIIQVRKDIERGELEDLSQSKPKQRKPQNTK